MIRASILMLAVLLCLKNGAASVAADALPLVDRPWFETRTAHFNIYSCGEPEKVFAVANQLEQFSEAYSSLAGASAVASPPVVVMAFPDHESLKPFLPLYQGKPANLAAFFQHGDDENLIVLSLPGADDLDMSVVFHEYTHLLLRRNDRIWPLWLKEGMAEIYSTFAVRDFGAVVAQPINHHLRLLAQEPLMPLTELFSVTHDSPQYNESSRQGIFYAESWLLTHYLFAGDNADYRARFGNFTTLLRAGQTPVQAFTNALGASLPQMESDLRGYLARGQFNSMPLALPQDVSSAKPLATRRLTPVENYFWLGDELLRIHRLDTAAEFFNAGQKLAPASPLPYEGLGLLAVERQQSGEAANEFKQALRLGSRSFLAHYFYAWEQFEIAAQNAGESDPLPPTAAAEIHDELLQSIVLMPDFGPAHELFGILEIQQSGNFLLGVQHLQLASQLEPENPYYQLALADAQWQNKDVDQARRTLAALLLPTAEASLRARAEELMQKIAAWDSIR